MHYKDKKVYVAVMILLFFTTCKKVNNTPQLPPITHNGVNITAFKIDGHNVVMYDNFIVPITFSNVAMEPIEIDASISNPPCGIFINFPYQDSLGVYPILWTYPYGAGFADNTYGSLTNTAHSASYQTDSLYNGSVNLIYYNGKEIAGYFHFDAISDSGVVVHITDGRFDIYKH